MLFCLILCLAYLLINKLNAFKLHKFVVIKYIFCVKPFFSMFWFKNSLKTIIKIHVTEKNTFNYDYTHSDEQE